MDRNSKPEEHNNILLPDAGADVKNAMDSSDLDFNYALENGIIDVQALREAVESMKCKKYLEQHPYTVWEKDGFWYTYLPDPTKQFKRRQVRRGSRENIEKEIIEYYRERFEEPTFEECYKNWSKEKLSFRLIQKQTYDRYETDYTRFLTKFGKTKVKNITEDKLYEFIMTTIRDNDLTAKAWGNLRTLIRGTMSYAKRKHFTNFSIGSFLADIDISRNAYRHRTFTDRESVFTEREIDLLYKEMDKEPDSVLCYGIRLCMLTGLRVGELSALIYTDMNKERGVLEVWKTEVRCKGEDGYIFTVREFTKGKYDRRQVPLMDETIRIIERLHDLNPDGVFLFEKNGKRVRGKAFSDKLVRLCKQAGIEPRSIHKIRKTFVTELKKTGMDDKAICAVVGHTQIETSNMYYYFNNTEIDCIANQMRSALLIQNHSKLQ